MPSAFMPSTAYVAEKIFNIDEGKDWDNATQEEKDACMGLARTAIVAIQSWQALHRADGSNRYGFEPVSSTYEENGTWQIFDKIAGREKPLGMVHDALLAQQIVDDLNRHDTQKQKVE